MSDLIDRQAALDAIDTWDKFGCNPDGRLVRYDDDKHYVPYVHYEDMVHAIKHLPPAQPETHEERTETHSCDLIDRQAAIDGKITAVISGQAIEAIPVSYIKQLPYAHSQRIKGKWIYGEDEYGIDGYHCNKCGFFVPWDYAHTFINYIKDYNFCPNCGADMRRGKEDASSR